MDYLTLGYFPETATVDYVTFIRHRDDVLREFNGCDANMLLVHHEELTELVTYAKGKGDRDYILARQTCCPDAIKVTDGMDFWFDGNWYECVACKDDIHYVTRVFIDHDIPKGDIHDYIMSHVVSPAQYAINLGYPQTELSELCPEYYTTGTIMNIIQFTDERRKSL